MLPGLIKIMHLQLQQDICIKFKKFELINMSNIAAFANEKRI